MTFDALLQGLVVALVFALVLAVVLRFRRRRWENERRQDRLRSAFDRASRVQGAGTGEQGKPYSLYGPRSWHEH